MSCVEIHALGLHLAQVVLSPEGWWSGSCLFVMGPCLRPGKGSSSLQTLSQVCIPLNQKLNVVWTWEWEWGGRSSYLHRERGRWGFHLGVGEWILRALWECCACRRRVWSCLRGSHHWVKQSPILQPSEAPWGGLGLGCMQRGP